MKFSSPLAVVVLASTADAFAWPQGWSSNWNSGGKPAGPAPTAVQRPAAQAPEGSHAAPATQARVPTGAPQGGFIGQQGGFKPPTGNNGGQLPSFAETFHQPAATGAPAAAAHPAAAHPAAAPAAAAGTPAAGASGQQFGGGFTGGNMGGGNMGGGNMGGGNMGAGPGGCPAVWMKVSGELNTMFAGCNGAARAAIRAIFHDCFPAGGCDGSIHLAAELSRPENAPMTDTVTALASLAIKYGVTVADTLAFAGCKYLHTPHSASLCSPFLCSQGCFDLSRRPYSEDHDWPQGRHFAGTGGSATGSQHHG
jgi:hypothetical protein